MPKVTLSQTNESWNESWMISGSLLASLSFFMLTRDWLLHVFGIIFLSELIDFGTKMALSRALSFIAASATVFLCPQCACTPAANFENIFWENNDIWHLIQWFYCVFDYKLLFGCVPMRFTIKNLYISTYLNTCFDIVRKNRNKKQLFWYYIGCWTSILFLKVALYEL